MRFKKKTSNAKVITGKETRSILLYVKKLNWKAKVQSITQLLSGQIVKIIKYCICQNSVFFTKKI